MKSLEYVSVGKAAGLFSALLICLIITSVAADDGANQLDGGAFEGAKITMALDGITPLQLIFTEGKEIPLPAFFDEYKQVFNISDENSFAELRVYHDRLGQTHRRFNQYYMGLKLEHVQFVLHERDGMVFKAHGKLIHALNMEVNATISEATALQYAISAVGASSYFWENPLNESHLQMLRDDPDATYYPVGELMLAAGSARRDAPDFQLAYRFDIYAAAPMSREYIYVDAHSGEIVNRVNRIHTNDTEGSGVSRYNGVVDIMIDNYETDAYRLRESERGSGVETYDMNGSTNYGAAEDFIHGDTFFDLPAFEVAVNTHWAAEATYDYYLNTHNRDSYDDQGSALRSYVHYSFGYDNAFWNGEVATFGDGSGNQFFALVSIDVVSHEYTHGITEYTAGLIYQAESGALNESFSDIFGTAVEFYLLGDEEADWLVGEDIMANGSHALRDMGDPNSLGDPDTYFGLYWAGLGGGDNGGVHTNSGVQNHWFYLLSAGGSGVNDNGDAFNVSGIGISDAEQIAYRNLAVYLTPSSGYFEARGGSIAAAADLFGEGSQQYNSTIDAWDAVGVYYPALIQTAATDEDQLEFIGEVDISQEIQELTIYNYGFGELQINNITLSDGQFSIVEMPALPLTLADFLDAIQLQVVFTPAIQGQTDATLAISSNDPNNPMLNVALNGWGYVINPAISGAIYATTGSNSDGVILGIDGGDGTGQLIGASGYDELRGMTIRPLNGELFGTLESVEVDMTHLVRIDAASGESHLAADLPVGMVRAIAFDSHDDIYYARFLNGEIHRYDYESATSTLLGSSGVNFLMGLAIDPTDDQLYGISLSGTLYNMDKESGAATSVGPIGFPNMSDLVFDANGNLFGLSGFQSDVSELIAIDRATGAGTTIGSTGFQGVTGIAITGVNPVGIDDLAASTLPASFKLHQNYPNPFNPSTTIRYDLPEAADLTLEVFTILGQKVRTLLMQKQTAGYQSIDWDGRNDIGRIAGSGVYVYRISAILGSGRKFIESKKMLLVK